MTWQNAKSLSTSCHCCLSVISRCPRWRKGGGSEHTDPRRRLGVSPAKASPQQNGSDLGISSDERSVRRVKCDETRPKCLRCTTTRRVCDGYPHVTCVDFSGLNRDRLALTVEPSADIHPCMISKRCFGFFVRETSPQLAGFFGSAFWERLVLQAAHHEPAIRHAITAIGALHEQHFVGKEIVNTFALQQYNLAIRGLLDPLDQQRKRGVDVCLISCILFTCFEVCPSSSMTMSHSLVLTSHATEYARTSFHGRVSYTEWLKTAARNCT